MAREILGHINCPHCGLTGGMRITLDKSGAPFGYCEGDCSGQMRVGGNPARVAKFYKQHPHLVQPGTNSAPTVTVPEKTKPAEAKKAPAAEKLPAPAPRKLTLFEQLAGVTNG